MSPKFTPATIFCRKKFSHARANYRTSKTYWTQPVFAVIKLKNEKNKNFLDFKKRKNREVSVGQVGGKDIP
jgi:hypothetical protein